MINLLPPVRFAAGSSSFLPLFVLLMHGGWQIMKMKKFLDKKVAEGKARPKLRDLDLTIPPAPWLNLRWYVSSHFSSSAPVFTLCDVGASRRARRTSRNSPTWTSSSAIGTSSLLALSKGLI